MSDNSAGTAGHSACGGCRVVQEHGLADPLQRVTLEGLAAGEQFVQHRAQRVQVGACVDAAGLQLLRRLVVRRAGDHAFQRRQRGMVRHARDAEVQHLGLVAPRQEDVGRLDVAMHDATRMRVGQRIGDTAHQQCGLGRARAPSAVQRLAQVAPAQPLHRDVHAVRRQASVVDGDDVGVVQPGRGARLVQEQRIQRDARGRVDVELQRLDRDHARQQRIPGLEHRAQAALAELLLQRIAADAGQRGPDGGVARFGSRIDGRIDAEFGEDVGHGRVRHGPGLETGHRDHGGREFRGFGVVYGAALEQAMSHSAEA